MTMEGRIVLANKHRRRLRKTRREKEARTKRFYEEGYSIAKKDITKTYDRRVNKKMRPIFQMGVDDAEGDKEFDSWRELDSWPL
jgi:hypothetical protein